MPMTNTNQDHIIMNVYNVNIVLYHTAANFSIFIFLASEDASSLNKQGISISDRRGDYSEIFRSDNMYALSLLLES